MLIYVTRLGIFLITVALVAGMVGCAPAQYDLTITSTAGGSVTTPGEGTFTYEEGTVVELVAQPDEGYQFMKWTSSIGAIADVYAAETTITINYHCSITANFTAEIWDWHDLHAIGDNLNGDYLLMNDLDSTTAGYEELVSPTANGGKGWEPIGSLSVDPFTGSLDGQGNEIKDLFFGRPDEDGVGLFGSVDGGGVVENLGITNIAMAGRLYVGGLVGGNMEGSVSNSYSSGSVTGNSSVGGLVGWNQDTVSNSYSTGSVTSNEDVGGLVGVNFMGTVTNSYSSGSVTGNSLVGGLVGVNWGGTVSNSFWDIQTSGQATSAGGTGKTTAEMQDIATFLGAAWDICTVAPGETNPAYNWNIVDGQIHPFLSWQSAA